jgi:hypothetical protein
MLRRGRRSVPIGLLAIGLLAVGVLGGGCTAKGGDAVAGSSVPTQPSASDLTPDRIGPDGRVDRRISGDTGSVPIAGQYTYAGTVVGVISLPPSSVTSGDRLKSSRMEMSAITATIHLTAPVDQTIGPLNLSQLASQLGGAAGAVSSGPVVSGSWRCTGDTLVTSVAADNTASGAWTFARTGPG